MQKTAFLTIFFLLHTIAFLHSQQTKLPVFYLKYDYGIGMEEEEDEEDLEHTSNKHKVTTRIKEDFNRKFTMNLYFIFFLKDYTSQTNQNYHYFKLNPDAVIKFNPKIRWYLGFTTK